MRRKIIGAAIGNCVHVAGVVHFLQLAEEVGYEVKFLGPAISVDKLFQSVHTFRPDIIGISYRLTPNNIIPLLEDIILRSKNLPYVPTWVFGGTKPVADIAEKYDFFGFISNGYDDIDDSIRFLRGTIKDCDNKDYGNNLLQRIKMNRPYPILRHHFGLPSLEATISGIKEISEAKILDVISLGTDQNAQQYFFKQHMMKRDYDGAGGVPIRNEEDLVRLKEASQRGNYPLMRCYSGTEDIKDYAKMLLKTIDNAWLAIPLSWYSELDGRSTRSIERTVAEAQDLIKWHAEIGLAVEINEPHHWGLRDSHDVIPVVMAYLSAYKAKKLGVNNYIAQFMFNTPSTTSFSMDFAKILAMLEMIQPLEDDNFHIFRETRAGLSLFHADEDVAKGQLAASTFVQMALKPHIIHVVGFCEANHAAEPKEVIESCKIVRGVIRHALNDSFQIEKNEKIINRKDELKKEALVLLELMKKKFKEYEDPLLEPLVLAECIKRGYIDAVHIAKGKKFSGNLSTKIINGKCVAYDKLSGKIVNEKERIKSLYK